MDQQSVIGIIELTSIIVAAGLGIASAVTETKNAKGKLTKWGIIAVAGIIISNSFSFIQSYLQQQQADKDYIASLEKEKIKDSVERAKYMEQMNLLYANIKKSDSSLQQQFRIQNQTSNVLSQVDKSIDVQNRIFQQSEVLNKHQLLAAENIDRTLNPLFPLKVDLSMKVKMDSATQELTLITEILKSKLKNKSSNSLKEAGILEVSQSEGDMLVITSGSQDYTSFINTLSRQDITLSFTTPDKAKSEIVCELDMGFLKEKNNLNIPLIVFNLSTETYIISIKDIPSKVVSNSGKDFNSTKDLINSNFVMDIKYAPGFITASQVNFKFPPDFSKITYIKREGNGQNILASSRTYNYVYKADRISFSFL